jgi:hypothetical protein
VIDPFDNVDSVAKYFGHETVHAHAGVGEELIDERHGVSFTPHRETSSQTSPAGRGAAWSQTLLTVLTVFS